MKILNNIPTIFKIASYQPKLMRGYELGRGRCNSSSASSVMRFHSLLCSSSNSRMMSLNFGPQGKSDKEFDIEDFKEENIEEVKELLRLHYYPREPQSCMLSMTYEDHKDLLQDSLKEWVEKNVSVIARDRQTGTVVGCCLETIVNRENISSSISNRARYGNYNLKSRYYFRLDEILKTSVDLFKKYNIETILQAEMATVCSTYGNRGNLHLLGQEARRKGKSQGCQLAIGIATNVFSQKSMRSTGYTLECEVNYADMRIDGKQVLDLSKSQGTTSVMLFSKRL